MNVPFAPSEPFRPAPGLGSPHAQTIFASFFRRKVRPPVVRERWETPDGDFVDVDLLDGAPESPVVIVLHGLEGSSRRGYVAAVLRGLHRRGWGGAALNFRSCSGELNRLPRSYHSGETGDALFVVGELQARFPGRPVLGVGFSLGGNVLLRLLEETGDAAPLEAAAVMSVPVDLDACCRSLDEGRGLGAVYRGRFLRTLVKKAVEKERLHPGTLDVPRLRAVTTMRAFDDCVTAPLHGFASAEAYYRACSSGPDLPLVRRPTLLLSSQDDPLVPPTRLDLGEFVTHVETARGGHVGFVAGHPVRPWFWGDEQLLRFLEAATGRRSVAGRAIGA